MKGAEGAEGSSIVVLCLTECARVMRGNFASRALKELLATSTLRRWQRRRLRQNSVSATVRLSEASEHTRLDIPWPVAARDGIPRGVYLRSRSRSRLAPLSSSLSHSLCSLLLLLFLFLFVLCAPREKSP